jgi:hypothetical protein
MSDLFSFIFAVLILILVITIFIRISLRVRRGGGSMTTVVLGATDEFLNEDKKRAVETIVNENAGKKYDGRKIKESE